MTRTLGELVWKITGDNKGFDKSAKDAQGTAKKLGGTLGGIGGIVKTALTGAAVAGLVAVSKKLVETAANAEETRNKFNVVFSQMGSAAETAATELAKGYGLSSRASQQLLADTGDLLTGFGFTQDAALGMSDQVAKLAVDLASFTNYSGGAEGAAQALRSGLLGEREAMKSLGIAIGEADIKQLAEEKGIVGELDRQTKAALTLEIALKQSKNSIGDFARSQSSFTNQMRIAKANTEDFTTILGQSLLPIANVGVSLFNDFADDLIGAAKGMKEYVTSAEGAEKIAGVLGAIAGTVSAIVETGKILLDPLADALSDIVEPIKNAGSATERGAVAFGIFGGVVQTASIAIRVLGTFIGGTIQSLISLWQYIKNVGAAIGDFFGILTGKTTIAEFKKTLAGVKDAGLNFAGDLAGTYADTWKVAADGAKTFGADSEAVANRIEGAFSRTAENIAAKTTEALTKAGEGNVLAGEATITQATETTAEIVDTTVEGIEKTTESAEKSLTVLQEKMVDLGTTGLNSLTSGFTTLGETLVNEGDAFNALGDIALNALADILAALGSQLAATAALGIAQAFVTGGASLVSVAPALAGSVAAFTASGAIKAAAAKYEDGGIVPGDSYTGDNVLVRVNSREMILNQEQQAQLFDQLNSGGGGQLSLVINLDGRQIAKNTINLVNNREILINARSVI